ncbi:hypothetical protein OsccyDRAFT_0627 [Leptolyngbyaceae cyanobacterium JSC-12]|nr:hypothetical protein OsccyDRAFT_0627 [Leptolyngbyaceae cyanobacterium JSC-12]
MIGLIAGAIGGTLIGVGTALIPGLGPQHAVAGASVLGLLGPDAAIAATITAYTVSNILGSAKEALTPNASGNVNVASGAQEEQHQIDPKQMTESSYWAKVIGSALGIFAATWLGGIVIPFTTLPITPVVAVLITALLWGSFKQHWWVILGYLFFSQAFFALAPMLNISNPIYVLGAAVFLIPGCIDAMRPKKTEPGQPDPRLQFEGVIKTIWLPDFIKLSIGTILAMATPGISPNLITQATSRKTNAGTQLTSAAAEQAIEAFGLIATIQGIATGKSVLAMELPLGVGFEAIALLLVGAIVSRILLPYVYNNYKVIGLQSGAHFIALAIATLTVILGAGVIPGAVLILTGLVTHFVIKSVGAPGTVRSLLFLGGVL